MIPEETGETTEPVAEVAAEPVVEEQSAEGVEVDPGVGEGPEREPARLHQMLEGDVVLIIGEGCGAQMVFGVGDGLSHSRVRLC